MGLPPPLCLQYRNACAVLVLTRDSGSGRVTIDRQERSMHVLPRRWCGALLRDGWCQKAALLGSSHSSGLPCRALRGAVQQQCPACLAPGAWSTHQAAAPFTPYSQRWAAPHPLHAVQV